MVESEARELGDQDHQEIRFHADKTAENRPISAIDNGEKLVLQFGVKVIRIGAGDRAAASSLSDNGGEDFSHRCEICNKGFSSGKALGGHMSTHYNQSKMRNLNFRHGFTEKKSPDEDRVSKCKICGMVFASDKAVFGHMRLHPKHTRTGISPPPANDIPNTAGAKISISKLDDRPVAVSPESRSGFDCSKHLPKWSLTGKRGRSMSINSAVDSSAGISEEEEKKIDVAVQELMYLATGTDRSPTSSAVGSVRDETDENSPVVGRKTRKRKLAVETDQAIIINNTEIGGEGSSTKPDCYKKQKQPLNSRDYSSDDEEEESLNSQERRFKFHRCTDKKTRKIEEIGKLKLFPANMKYRCSICNKSFPTHQALGGHKSSHSKPYKKAQSLVHELSSPEIDSSAASLEEDEENNDIATPATKKLSTQSSQVTSPEESSLTGRRIFNFDLNEIPPLEEGEEAWQRYS